MTRRKHLVCEYRVWLHLHGVSGTIVLYKFWGVLHLQLQSYRLHCAVTFLNHLVADDSQVIVGWIIGYPSNYFTTVLRFRFKHASTNRA